MKKLLSWVIASFAFFAFGAFAHVLGASDSHAMLYAVAAGATTKGFMGRGYLETANLISSAALTVGGTTIFSKELPLGEGWTKLLLRFNHVLTIGSGTTAVTEGELLIIKNVLLKTDRSEILCNLPGRAIFKIATYQTRQVPRKDAIAASSSTYRVTLPIIFADMLMNRPADTILDTSRYNSITLQITYGTTADILGTPGTSSLAPTLDIDVERSLGKLNSHGKPGWHISYDYRQPIDANSGTVIDLERSADMAVKRLYVHSSTSGTGGVPWSGTNADTIQSVVQIKDQNRYLQKDRIHAMVQDGNKMDALLESVIAGVEIFDFVRDGSITSSVQTGNKSVFQYTWTNQGGVGANSIITATTESIRTLK